MPSGPAASAIDAGISVCFPLSPGYSIYRLAQGKHEVAGVAPRRLSNLTIGVTSGFETMALDPILR
jgi:hypothetical protein